MNSLVGIYQFVAVLPLGVVVIFLILGGVFVPFSRRFIEERNLELNVSLCSWLGGAALAICIFLSAEIFKQQVAAGSVKTPLIFQITNIWHVQIGLLGIFIGIGVVMASMAARGTNPQGFTDYVNNLFAVPLELFIFSTLILSSFFVGGWTWRHYMILFSVITFAITFIVDVLEGRMEQWKYVFANRTPIIKEIRNLFPNEPFGWVEDDKE